MSGVGLGHLLHGLLLVLQEEETLRSFVSLMGRTGIRDLSLSGCRLHCVACTGVARGDAELQGALLAALAASAPDLAANLTAAELLFLRLAGLQVGASCAA